MNLSEGNELLLGQESNEGFEFEVISRLHVCVE